jgi:DNA-binding NarL/FixJ family response regulator
VEVTERARRRGPSLRWTPFLRAVERRHERARAIFEQLGARLWLAKARHELDRTGLRGASGDELSPTEQQVAELAAGGSTNKEIAGALFMSVKTVEANLSRVYRKLEVRSRTELASRLGKAS